MAAAAGQLAVQEPAFRPADPLSNERSGYLACVGLPPIDFRDLLHAAASGEAPLILREGFDEDRPGLAIGLEFVDGRRHGRRP